MLGRVKVRVPFIDSARLRRVGPGRDPDGGDALRALHDPQPGRRGARRLRARRRQRAVRPRLSLERHEAAATAQPAPPDPRPADSARQPDRLP